MCSKKLFFKKVSKIVVRKLTFALSTYVVKCTGHTGWFRSAAAANERTQQSRREGKTQSGEIDTAQLQSVLYGGGN